MTAFSGRNVSSGVEGAMCCEDAVEPAAVLGREADDVVKLLDERERVCNVASWLDWRGKNAAVAES